MKSLKVQVCSVLLLAAGCLGGLEPDVGPKIAGQCENEDSNPEEDVSFTDQVLPMLAQRCGCHDPKGSGSAIDTTGFSVGSHKDLKKGGNKTTDKMLISGDACNSVLVQKCSEAVPYGSRMPMGGPYFTPTEMNMLRDWIVEGAHE